MNAYFGKCTWDYTVQCGGYPFGWRYDTVVGQWKCVCAVHFDEGAKQHEPTVTSEEVRMLAKAQEEAE